MRGTDHVSDPVRDRDLGHRDGGFEVFRPVVKAEKKMVMYVYHCTARVTPKEGLSSSQTVCHRLKQQKTIRRSEQRLTGAIRMRHHAQNVASFIQDARYVVE
jgi:hypothetical protein